MPPKRANDSHQGGGPPHKRGLDYPRPFFNKALTRSEIQEDLALITSSMKREHRAPSRYASNPSSARDHGEGRIPSNQGQHSPAHPSHHMAGSQPQAQQPRTVTNAAMVIQQRQSGMPAQAQYVVQGQPRPMTPPSGPNNGPGRQPGQPQIVYHTVVPVMHMQPQQQRTYVVGST